MRWLGTSHRRQRSARASWCGGQGHRNRLRWRMKAKTWSNCRPAPVPPNLTLKNNHAVVTVSGVSDRLRVLLGRARAPCRREGVAQCEWRSVGGTWVNSPSCGRRKSRQPRRHELLSLIAFPARMLQEKLGSLDLVVFDRYRERGVAAAGLSSRYIRLLRQEGGAMLISSGPEGLRGAEGH